MSVREDEAVGAEAATKQSRWLLLAPLLALVLFLPTLGHQFVWDDFPFLVHNEAIRSLDNIPSFFYDESTAAARLESPGIYRPLRNVVWSLGYSAFKLNAAGYHLQNTLIHALNCLLVVGLALALGLRRDAAVVAGCAFAVHPLVTEAVSWVKAVDDLLVATFLIAGAAVSARVGRQLALGVEPTWRTLMALGALQVGALMSKEIGVVFPALALLTLWLGFCMHRDAQDPMGSVAVMRRILSERLALCFILAATVMNAVYLSVRTRVLGEVGQLEEPLAAGASLFFTQIRAIGQGLALVIWPSKLQADYDSYRLSTAVDAGSGAALLVVVVLLASVIVAVRKGRWWCCWAWVVLWWFVVLLPVSNIVPTMQFMAERFLYSAVVAPAMGLAFLFDRVSTLERVPRRTLLLITTLLLAALALRTSTRLSDWESPTSLFGSVVEQNPRVERALGNLCRSLFVEGRYRESLDRLRQLERLSPTSEILGDLMEDAAALAEVEDDLPDLLERLDREPGNVELRLQMVDLALHARHLGTVRLFVEGLPPELEWRRSAALAVVAGHRGEEARALELLQRAAGLAGPSGPGPGELERFRSWVERALEETSRMDFIPPEKPPEGLSWGS